MINEHPHFDTGFVVRTFEALKAMISMNHSEWSFIERHQRGEFGEVSAARREANLRAVNADTGRVFSSYRLGPNLTLWIVTWLDVRGRRVTTLMLPCEYASRARAARPRERAGRTGGLERNHA